jgi:hypothetical protein
VGLALWSHFESSLLTRLGKQVRQAFDSSGFLPLKLTVTVSASTTQTARPNRVRENFVTPAAAATAGAVMAAVAAEQPALAVDGTRQAISDVDFPTPALVAADLEAFELLCAKESSWWARGAAAERMLLPLGGMLLCFASLCFALLCFALLCFAFLPSCVH